MDVVLLFAMVIGLLMIGVPIAVSLGLSSMIFLLLFSAFLYIAKKQVWSRTDH